MTTAEHIPVGKILVNEGQIKNVPANPRFIKSDRYEKLKQSIKDDPEMLELRELIVYPLDNDYICVAGNMRLRAMQELGYTECPCKVVPAKTSAKKLRAYIIKDNLPFGETDFSLLGDQWDMDELKEWGFPEWKMGIEKDKEQTPKEPKSITCPKCGEVFDA